MKVEIISDGHMNIFFNKCFVGEIYHLDKRIMSSNIKKLIDKAIRIYKLQLDGFYRIKVYPNEKIGVFLDIVKIDDNEFISGVDYRILIYLNDSFYLESDEYLEKYNNIRYYDNKFYINIDDISDITKVIDYGKVIFGDEANNITKKGIKIKRG